MAISMLKIRRPLGRLIFNMGIAIPGKTVFLIETAPRWANCPHHCISPCVSNGFGISKLLSDQFDEYIQYVQCMAKGGWECGNSLQMGPLHLGIGLIYKKSTICPYVHHLHPLMTNFIPYICFSLMHTWPVLAFLLIWSCHFVDISCIPNHLWIYLRQHSS